VGEGAANILTSQRLVSFLRRLGLDTRFGSCKGGFAGRGIQRIQHQTGPSSNSKGPVFFGLVPGLHTCPAHSRTCSAWSAFPCVAPRSTTPDCLTCSPRGCPPRPSLPEISRVHGNMGALLAIRCLVLIACCLLVTVALLVCL